MIKRFLNGLLLLVIFENYYYISLSLSLHWTLMRSCRPCVLQYAAGGKKRWWIDWRRVFFLLFSTRRRGDGVFRPFRQAARPRCRGQRARVQEVQGKPKIVHCGRRRRLCWCISDDRARAQKKKKCLFT